MLYGLEWPPPNVAVLLTLAARRDGPRKEGAIAWDTLVRSRALVLDETGYRNRVTAHVGDPEVLFRRKELRAASSVLAGMLVRGEAQGEAFEAAVTRRDAAETALTRLSYSDAKEHAKTRAGLADVRRAVPEGTALVALVRANAIPLGRSESSPARGPSRPAYMAFVLPPGADEPVTVDLGDAETIDKLVTNWRHEVVGRNAAAYRSAGAALRRKIWDPIAATLAGAKRVFVVPDGALHLVNLAALPTAGGRYLIETGPTIHYLSAERDIVAPVDRTKGPARLLALGGADYDAASLFAAFRQDEPIALEGEQPALVVGLRPFRGERSACGEFKARRFEPLPGTAEESTAIAALWREGREGADDNLVLLTDAGAAEAALKAEAPKTRILHLATHGFFLGGECAETASGARGIGTLAERASLFPSSGETLRLSGLALAGANHRDAAGPDEEDGILTAEEIAALDLSNVEWAVLSACDTGVGDIKTGEGVFGLRRACQVAGAGTLIASLWPVDDESTREWMTALYEGRLKERLDTAEAVRRASLKVLERRRAAKQSTHPFHWAAFVASGDWR
jgi:CHAT domain-containing protein